MPLKVLVVEDHAPFRRLTCEALHRRPGFEIVEAADGVDAVRKAEAAQPDLILLDLNLPGMHGFEVARQCASRAPRARVLFLSQESAPDIVQEALRLGAGGYVQKASAAMDLFPAIDAVLAGRQFVSRSVDLRRHEILFCVDDAAIVTSLARRVVAALERADAAIAIVTADHRIHLLHELRARGLKVDEALRRGTFALFDSDVALDCVQFVDAIDTARTGATRAGNPAPRIAFCGERAGRLWAAGRTAEAAQLEQFCGDLPRDVDILCVYPVPYTTDDEAIRSICADHTAVSSC
jgi:DNA-binding NarL/FixJ family response regulator